MRPYAKSRRWEFLFYGIFLGLLLGVALAKVLG